MTTALLILVAVVLVVLVAGLVVGIWNGDLGCLLCWWGGGLTAVVELLFKVLAEILKGFTGGSE